MAAPELTATTITTERLSLEPLRMSHADELVDLLDDQSLHTHIGGEPASLAQLRGRIDIKTQGESADGRQRWLNWVIRTTAGDVAGYVQATAVTEPGGVTAELAWVVGVAHQRQGVAGEAAAAMQQWLADRDVRRLVAHIHPGNVASQRVARQLGLQPTDVVLDGETEWVGT